MSMISTVVDSGQSVWPHIVSPAANHKKIEENNRPGNEKITSFKALGGETQRQGGLLTDTLENDRVEEAIEADFDLSLINADDILALYLKEAAQTPLLTPVEEITLAKQIEKGRWAEKKLTSVACDSEEAERLKAYVREANQARNRLINANTRLVISIAKKYRGQEVPLADLIQEGNLGLMRAVEKFDYRRGYKFSTYAMWWIRQTVSRGLINQNRTIRLPIHVNERP